MVGSVFSNVCLWVSAAFNSWDSSGVLPAVDSHPRKSHPTRPPRALHGLCTGSARVNPPSRPWDDVSSSHMYITHTHSSRKVGHYQNTLLHKSQSRSNTGVLLQERNCELQTRLQCLLGVGSFSHACGPSKVESLAQCCFLLEPVWRCQTLK